jgi:hypothetical protein
MRSSNLRCACVTVATILLALATAPAFAGTPYNVNNTQSASAIQGVINGLQPGDTLTFAAGTYNDAFKVPCNGTATNPITIQGVSGSMPTLDGTGVDVSGGSGHPRALMEISGNYVTVQNLAFQNARNGDNGAGIRLNGSNNSTVSACKITYCDMGMQSNDTGTVLNNALITGCEVAYNGTASHDGGSHNFYMDGSGKVTIIGNYIHDSLYGQNVKTRAHYVQLMYNWISNSNEGEIGPVDDPATATANSNFLMVGNTVVSKVRPAGDNTQKYVLYGSESGNAHIGTLYMYNNTCVAGQTSNVFVQLNPLNASDGTYAVLKNNIFYGSTNMALDQTTGGVLAPGHISGSNNLVPVGASWPSGTSITNSVVTNTPGFVNPSANDFRLLVGSAAINAGASDLTYVDGDGNLQSLSVLDSYLFGIGDVARAMSGSAMDIGAYEFQQTPEPATLALLAMGGLGLLARARRRSR